jgi:hypothetical protein
MEITERDRQMAAMDISYWYMLHKELCPNCGWVLKDLHPAANLMPHWTGKCKAMREAEYLQELQK